MIITMSTLVYKLHRFAQIWALETRAAAYLQDHLFWELIQAWFGIVGLALCSCFKQLLFALLEKLHSN